MNKKELTVSMAEKTGLTGSLSAKVIDALFQSLKESIEQSDPITINGFGRFSITQRAERRGVNPSTRQPMTIAAHNMVRFSVSKKITIK